jgi:hypothetical protein
MGIGKSNAAIWLTDGLRAPATHGKAMVGMGSPGHDGYFELTTSSVERTAQSGGIMSSVTNDILRSRSLRAVRAAATRWVRRGDRMLTRPAAWSLAIASVLIFQALLIATHRPWLDEVQAVQIAVQAPDLPTLLQWLRYEGHPPLWYLLLRGLSYLVDPLWALPLAAALCALAAQSAILFASPFTRAERLLIATSEFVLFEHLTISRSLGLGAAALFVAMALWRRRTGWIAIAVLPMCDFLFGVMSLFLVVLKLRGRSLWWPGMVMWAISGAIAAWSVIPAPDAVPAILSRSLVGDIGFWTATMGNLLVPWQGPLIPRWNSYPFFPVAACGWVAFIWFAWVQTDRDKVHRLLLMGLIALTFVFSLAVYRLSARHLMIIALALILLTWRLRSHGDRPRAGFRLWLMAASLCGIATGALNLVWPFNRSPEVAERIAELGLTHEHWVVFPENRAQVVSALTGIEFEQAEQRCRQSFIRWDHATAIETKAHFRNLLRREAREHGRGYLLSDEPFNNLPGGVLDLIDVVRGGYDGQDYYLYVIGRDQPKRNVSLPPCVPDKRPFARLRGRAA